MFAQVHELHGHLDAVTSLAWSAQGDLLASCSGDGTLKVWRELQFAADAEHGSAVNAGVFSSTSGSLASAAQDGVVRVWDTSRLQEPVAALAGHAGPATSCCFAKEMVASGSTDGSVKVWDARTSGPICSLENQRQRAISSVHANADASLLVSSCLDGKVTVWDLTAGRERTSCDLGAACTSATFTPNGKYVLIGSVAPGSLKLWRHGDGKTLKTYEGFKGDSMCLGSDFFTSTAKFILAGADDGAVHVYNLNSTKEAQRIAAHAGAVHAVRAHPKTQHVATASADKSIKVWKV